MKLRICRACNRPCRHAHNRQAPPTSFLTKAIPPRASARRLHRNTWLLGIMACLLQGGQNGLLCLPIYLGWTTDGSEVGVEGVSHWQRARDRPPIVARDSRDATRGSRRVDEDG